jgi:hypothetical protein
MVQYCKERECATNRAFDQGTWSDCVEALKIDMRTCGTHLPFTESDLTLLLRWINEGKPFAHSSLRNSQSTDEAVQLLRSHSQAPQDNINKILYYFCGCGKISAALQ